MNTKLIFRAILVVGVVVAVAGAASWFMRPDGNENPLKAGSGDSVTVLEFSALNGFETLPKGWAHRTFWFTSPMQLAQKTHEGVVALNCKTDNGGSILGRNTDIDLAAFPLLSWDWFIEQPITSEVDERTKAGDDHPARLLIRFEDTKGAPHFVEIIWSNRMFVPGDYKYIEDFPHYVANGLEANIGRWHHQQVDLLDIYRTTSGLKDNPKVRSVAIFCDSDNTGGQSSAYFSDVVLARR